jgi:hypothetical protein
MIYPDKLESFLMRYPEYIPYKIDESDDNHLQIYRRYWVDDMNEIIKVLDVYEINEIEYYFIKISSSFYGIKPYPVEGLSYELIPDKTNIKRRFIIGDDMYYSGAVIKFWFFTHGMESGKYKSANKYLNLTSKYLIDDNEFYKVFKDQRGRIIIEK